ncbi:CapA family protein [Symbiobacterium terraclitae]|uniref:CapA family protein n=1 Tax=Symbiobacterium terraclitae TaxID=557451 RepID=UPI0035B52DC1
MRTHTSVRLLPAVLAVLMILAACSRAPAPRTSPDDGRQDGGTANGSGSGALVLAAPPDLPLPALGGVEVLRTDQPAAALARGEADAAVVDGEPPPVYASFPLTAREHVILQGWLDEPMALTLDEARALLPTLGSPGEPGRGALAAGRLADLHPGWRAVPVDGVVPTPQTVRSGEYPLADRLFLAYRPEAADRVAPLREPLQTGLDNGAGGSSQAGQAGGIQGDWISLSVAGDLMLARGVARAMRENGTLYPILKVMDHLSAADLAFANLESPIGVKGSPLPGKQIWFRAAPEAVEVLKAAGLDGVTVANNHIMDYDEENYLETLDMLAEAGIPWTGGGRNLAEARRPLVLEARGVRVAFLGYSEFADLFFDWDYPRSFAATEDRPGVPAIREDWLAEDIRAARAVADVVAVALHWGVEFTNYPTEEQQRLARYMVDQGADLVLGYHPHAIQGFEIYGGRVIAYSLGNFVMDRQDTDLARESMILDFLVGPDGVKQVEVRPVWIEAEQPYLLEGEEAARLRAKMQEISGW